jgi:hypothetical protein
MQRKIIKGVKVIWISERGDELGIQVIYKGKFYDGYLRKGK